MTVRGLRLAAATALLSMASCQKAKATEDLPYSMTCEFAPADGTSVRRCTNDTDVCYILGDSISCRLKEAGE